MGFESMVTVYCPKLVRGVLIFALILAFSLFMSGEAAGEDRPPGEGVIYYFWGYCPTCSKPEEHIDLFDPYPLEVRVYEVFQDQAGRRVYERIAGELGLEVRGFPTVVFNDQYWLGFSETVQEEIIAEIEAFLSGVDRGERRHLDIPFMGPLDLQESPLLITTFVIAFLDGFNPCSLFVLTFLLAIIVHSASRKRVLAVGLTFLLVTASVYGFFILGILNIMVYAARLFWIRNIVAAAVIVFGLVALKDYLHPGEGFSLAIPDKYKSLYYRQVRRVFQTSSAIPMLTGTALMALGIALVELPCTAGLPFIWSSLLSGLEPSAGYFAFLFAVYLFTYLSVELVIFGTAVIRMRSVKMTEEKGRLLKLVSGCLMLVMGFVLLIAPAQMEDFRGLAITLSATALLILIIYIGRSLIRHRQQL